MTTISVSVCGKIFEIDLEIIRRSALFANMIDDVGIPDKPIFISRSPKLFEHVLAFLIDENYPFPLKYQSELKYYLIEYDPAKLYDPESIVKRKLKNIKASIRNLEEKINDEKSRTCVNCNDEPLTHSSRCKWHHKHPCCSFEGCYNDCENTERYCSYHS